MALPTTAHRNQTLCNLNISRYFVYLALHRKLPCHLFLRVSVGTVQRTLESGFA